MIAAFEPPPRLTVSEWADQYRRLSSEASAEAGDWKTDRAPYQRAMMDALTPNSPYERVVVMAASQTGKTELALNFCGYIIDRDPGPTLVVLPRVEDGEAWSKDRLAAMLRNTPSLRGRVADVRSRDSNNQIRTSSSRAAASALRAPTVRQASPCARSATCYSTRWTAIRRRLEQKAIRSAWR